MRPHTSLKEIWHNLKILTYRFDRNFVKFFFSLFLLFSDFRWCILKLWFMFSKISIRKDVDKVKPCWLSKNLITFLSSPVKRNSNVFKSIHLQKCLSHSKWKLIFATESMLLLRHILFPCYMTMTTIYTLLM